MLETAIRRFRWLQQMVCFASRHVQVASALFGKLTCGDLEFSVIDVEGNIDMLNPYAASFANAVALYKNLPGCETFFVC